MLIVSVLKTVAATAVSVLVRVALAKETASVETAANVTRVAVKCQRLKQKLNRLLINNLIIIFFTHFKIIIM